MSSFLIDSKPYELDPADPALPSWEVEVNGQLLDAETIKTVTVVNRKMGMGFLYGKSPAGPYNQGRFVNRGGAVIIPTLVNKNWDFHFLALKQVRPLYGPDPILEFPRGQANPGESTIDTARRELIEETGLPISEQDLTYLGVGNPDTAVTHGANVHAWRLNIPLELVDDSGKTPKLRAFHADTESRLVEQIRGAIFIPAGQFSSPSMMSQWAAGLVFQQMYRSQSVE